MTKDTKTETAELLQRWLESWQKIEAAYKDLRLLFGASPESAVVGAMYETHAQLTKLVAEKVGDKDGWLDWFLWDNAAGQRGMEAKAPGWKRPRKIKNVKDLETLIADCKKPTK